MQDRKFMLKQVATLTKLGVSEADIERTIKFVDAHLPEGTDAATWIPSAADLSNELITEATLLDAKEAIERGKNKRLARLLRARQAA